MTARGTPMLHTQADGASPRPQRRRWAGLVAGVASSALLGFLLMRGVDLERVGASLGGAKRSWLIAVALSTVLGDVIRAMRWQIILTSRHPTALGLRLRSVLAGSAGNHLLPLRLGEVARIHLLSDRAGVPYATTLATLVVERVFDVLGMVAVLQCCLIAFPAAREIDPRINAAMDALTVCCGVLLATGVVALAFRDRTSALVDKAIARVSSGRWRRLSSFGRDLVGGVRSLGDWRHVATAAACTAAMWLVFGMCFAFGLMSLGLNGPDAGSLVARTSLTMVFVSIFTMVPAAFGLVGTFQAGCVVALSAFGVPKAESLAFSVVVHATQLVTCAAVGAPFLVSSLRRSRSGRTR